MATTASSAVTISFSRFRRMILSVILYDLVMMGLGLDVNDLRYFCVFGCVIDLSVLVVL